MNAQLGSMLTAVCKKFMYQNSRDAQAWTLEMLRLPAGSKALLLVPTSTATHTDFVFTDMHRYAGEYIKLMPQSRRVEIAYGATVTVASDRNDEEHRLMGHRFDVCVVLV